MLSKQQYHTGGPFRAEQLRCGDPYELDDGHPIKCLPSGGRHANANLNGGLTLDTDPDVEAAGFDAGFTPDEQNLRAPDIAVGNVLDTPGWVPGAPPLAVEYADTGQDERDLQAKIHTLLGAGTRHIWVVCLSGVRRVEVYEPQAPRRLAYPGEQLRAPGILKNPVPVEALYDPDAAREAALRNLLQRRGYADLDAVREEGRLALVLRQLQRVIGPIPEEDSRRIRRLGGDDLTALAEALLDFRAESDLTAWLERHIQGTLTTPPSLEPVYEAMTRAAETISKEAPPIYQNRVANKLQDDDGAAHRWYCFVLSFPPHLVRDYLEDFEIEDSG